LPAFVIASSSVRRYRKGDGRLGVVDVHCAAGAVLHIAKLDAAKATPQRST
jgi:hypothetical protein